MSYQSSLKQELTQKNFLTPLEASQYLDGAIKPSTLRNWRCNQHSKGPSWYKLGREIRYKVEDLNLFIERCRQSLN